jgi:alcohol dehydrogenase class IV
MKELRKFVSPEFVFGDGSSLLLGQYIMHFGASKIFLITDKTVKNQTWFFDIVNNLNDYGIDYIVFDEVSVNPKDVEVSLGSKCYIEHECDMIVAVGGGSVMDCGKGIGVLVTNPGTIYDYEGVDQVIYPIPPLICIPTTSGSSADVSQFAIITDTRNMYKMAFASKILVPDLALLDPLVTLTCDFDLTVDAGIDALVHAIEAYVSNASSFITDINALSAIEKIFKFLPSLSKDLHNLELRRLIMGASLTAGLAFSNASLGLAHAMAHAVGGRLDLVHGEMNALLLEHVIEFNYECAKEKYDKIHKILGEVYGDYPRVTIGLKHFINDIRENKKVDAVGLETIYQLSEYVLNDPCIVTNPKVATTEDVVMIYEKIFK